MKAGSAKRKRSRRGRPAEDGIEREPNGRRQRSKPREDIRMVAIDGRARVLGVSKELAALGECGTVQGRLWQEGRIEWELKKAADDLAKWHAAKERALMVPDSLATGSMGSSSQEASESYAEWATAAVGKWEVGREWLEKHGTRQTFEHCILRGNYPTAVDLSVLIIGLSYVAGRLGYYT